MDFLKVWCGKNETFYKTTKEVSTNPVCTNTMRYKIYPNNIQAFSSYLQIYRLRLHYNEVNVT